MGRDGGEIKQCGLDVLNSHRGLLLFMFLHMAHNPMFHNKTK